MFKFTDIDPVVNLDNRFNQTHHPISAFYYNELYSKILSPDVVKDKVILDLGACLGPAGIWSLEYGCKEYVGVEIQEDYFNKMSSILDKYENKQLIKGDILEYLANTDKKFDLIICSGIIYAFVDYYNVLRLMDRVCSGDIIINYAITDKGVVYTDTPLNSSKDGFFVSRNPRISVETMCFLMSTLGYDTIIDRHKINIKNYLHANTGRAVSHFRKTNNRLVESTQDKIKNPNIVDATWK